MATHFDLNNGLRGGLVWHVVWHVPVGASTPKECRYIGATELAFLNKVCQQDDDDDDDDNVAAASSTGGTETSKQESKQEGALAKLWKGLLLLLKSPAAMSVVFVALSNNWTQVTFDVYAPQYYTSHFNVDAREAGALVAVRKPHGLRACACACEVLLEMTTEWVMLLHCPNGVRTP